jgi:Transglycosylase SLT domain
MKKLLILLLMTNLASVCLAASDAVSAMYGTAENPLINGVPYDIHKAYIEPNEGSVLGTNSSVPVKSSSKQIIVQAVGASFKQPANLKSDDWATDTKVEQVLKQAASEGKLSYVLDQAKKANVPASVAILPIVESNYNKTAVSPKGAGGAWQLMPGTTNDYGIKAKDRFDFNSSTDVAIQLLNDLHQEFGNWALAFAAYNCGSHCVINALKHNPGATDIDELSLPTETKNYVHKIIKLNQLIAGLDSINNKRH